MAFNICYTEEIQAYLFSTHMKPNGCGQYTAVLPPESTDSQEAIITGGRKMCLNTPAKVSRVNEMMDNRQTVNHSQVCSDTALVPQQAAVAELDGWYQLALALCLCLIPTKKKKKKLYMEYIGILD